MTRVKKLELIDSLQKAIASLTRARAFCDCGHMKKKINWDIARIEQMVKDLRAIPHGVR